MGEAIGQVLPLAVGVAISPLPIVAVVLMLVTPRARTNGPAFIVGWLLGLAVVGVVFLAIAGPSDASDDGQPATWVSWLKLILGVLLLFVALKQWRARPPAGQPGPAPKWMGAVDTFTPVKAAGAGAVLSGLNPKNLLLAVGACAAIAQTGASGADQAVAYVVFALIATIGVAAPVVIFFAMGERSRQVLDRLKARMEHGNAAIMAVLCLVIGAKLIGDAISGFSA
jgi:threonine/homoserine/homoserine lactone efflux protein